MNKGHWYLFLSFFVMSISTGLVKAQEPEATKKEQLDLGGIDDEQAQSLREILPKAAIQRSFTQKFTDFLSMTQATLYLKGNKKMSPAFDKLYELHEKVYRSTMRRGTADEVGIMYLTLINDIDEIIGEDTHVTKYHAYMIREHAREVAQALKELSPETRSTMGVADVEKLTSYLRFICRDQYFSYGGLGGVYDYYTAKYPKASLATFLLFLGGSAYAYKYHTDLADAMHAANAEKKLTENLGEDLSFTIDLKNCSREKRDEFVKTSQELAGNPAKKVELISQLREKWKKTKQAKPLALTHIEKRKALVLERLHLDDESSLKPSHLEQLFAGVEEKLQRLTSSKGKNVSVEISVLSREHKRTLTSAKNILSYLALGRGRKHEWDGITTYKKIDWASILMEIEAALN